MIQSFLYIFQNQLMQNQKLSDRNLLVNCTTHYTGYCRRRACFDHVTVTCWIQMWPLHSNKISSCQVALELLLLLLLLTDFLQFSICPQKWQMSNVCTDERQTKREREFEREEDKGRQPVRREQAANKSGDNKPHCELCPAGRP